MVKAAVSQFTQWLMPRPRFESHLGRSNTIFRRLLPWTVIWHYLRGCQRNMITSRQAMILVNNWISSAQLAIKIHRIYRLSINLIFAQIFRIFGLLVILGLTVFSFFISIYSAFWIRLSTIGHVFTIQMPE